jgi:hypothetical protein
MQLIINHPDLPWTAIPNVILRDTPQLSWKAKGLYSYFLSCPPGWTVRMADLVARAKDGRDAVNAGIRELEEHGFLSRHQAHNASGKFDKTIIEIHLPLTEKPLTDKPYTAKPLTENPLLNNNDLNKIDINNPDVTNHAAAVEKAEAGPKAEAPGEMLFKPGPGDFDFILANIKDVWNAMAERAGIQRITKLGKYRSAAIRNEARENPEFLKWWAEAINGIETLPFLIGKADNTRGWVADFDWFLKNAERVYGWVQSRKRNAAGTVSRKDFRI